MTLKNAINIKGKNNQISIADSVHLHDCNIIIRGNNNQLFFGKNSIICSANMELVGNNNQIMIGDKVTIYGSFLAAHGGKSIIIGEGCAFANPTDIRTSDHHPIFDAENQRINPDQDVIIGDRVWLTREVSVLKGSTIESDVVVGMRSVVTGHVPAHSIVAGIPAKVVRQGITWQL